MLKQFFTQIAMKSRMKSNFIEISFDSLIDLQLCTGWRVGLMRRRDFAGKAMLTKSIVKSTLFIHKVKSNESVFHLKPSRKELRIHFLSNQRPQIVSLICLRRMLIGFETQFIVFINQLNIEVHFEKSRDCTLAMNG